MVGFDENDEPILDFNTPEVKALEKVLDYAEKNNISVLFGEWGTPYKMHDLEEGHGDKFTGANDPKWINIIVKSLFDCFRVSRNPCWRKFLVPFTGHNLKTPGACFYLFFNLFQYGQPLVHAQSSETACRRTVGFVERGLVDKWDTQG